MAKTCVTEKTANRQRWIEQGLLDLMLQKRFEEITVAELCRNLDLSRRSFYRYFDDLEDVLDSLLDHTYMDMAVPDELQSMEELEYTFGYWLEQRDLLEALWKSGMSTKIVECTLRYSSQNVIEKRMLNHDPNLDYLKEAVLFVNSGLGSLVITWHIEGFQKTPRQMAQIAYQLLTEPIVKI